MRKKYNSSLVSVFSTIPEFFLLFLFMLSSIVVNSTALSGVYTIDPNGSGSYNYNSFSAAVSDLTSEGVSGNVFFLVADGIYTDQIEIGSISGASDNSKIIFSSASGIDTNVVLQYSATADTNNWVVKFSGAKCIVFKHITIKAQGNSYGRCFLFDGNSEHNILDSLIIMTKPNATNYNHAPIFMTGGENHYNIIMDCIIKGGSHGVYMQGTSSLSNHGNIIYRNEISEFRSMGILGSYNDSTMVAGNLIYYNTGSGSPKGIYLYYQTGESSVVSNGVVLNGGNSLYGISVSGSAPATSRGLIANNFVSVDGGPSTVGIRLYNLTNYDVYYNSVNTVGLNSTAALYHTGGSSIDIVNNIFNKEGGNYAFYTNSPSSIGMADYNCLYNEDTTLAYWNGVRETLSDLQSASSKFQNSIHVNPLFVSFSDFHVDQDDLDGAATPLARVTNDLDQEPRDTINPDIGADEFTPFHPFVEQTGFTLEGVKNGSAAWADYDNDGYLDILIAGETDNAVKVCKLYKNNGNNTFSEQTSIALQGVTYSAVAWGDYDNDGDLDILLSGKTNSGVSGAFSAIYRNNGNNTFSQQTAINLTGMYQGDVAWGDFDNDGDLDILMSGLNSTSTYVTKIYRNDGSSGSSWSFVELTGLSLIGVYNSSLAWGDYDNDGDLDILLTGDNGTTNVSKVYQNNGATQGGGWSFVDQATIVLTGVSNSEAEWGDIDNDGDLDILITGNNAAPLSKIYRNMGNNNFVYQASINIVDLDHASFAWKDFDSNGTIDLIMSGNTDTGFVSLAYRNAGGGNYILEPSVVLDDIAYGAMDAADYDNDGDLDILITGEDNSSNAVSKVFKSYIGTDSPIQVNSPPSAPTGLTTFMASDSILFMWNTPTDNSTDSLGFTFNIQIGTSPNATDIYAPSANLITGKNLLAETGAILDTFCWIVIDDSLAYEDTIFWSVQAVDLGFEASMFSVTDTLITHDVFTEIPTTSITALKSNSETWGDYDNDGDLDLLITGEDASNNIVSKIYRNDGAATGDAWNFVEELNIALLGVVDGVASWADYNNDGYLDILITGQDNANNAVAKIYRNDGTPSVGAWSFTEQTNINLPGIMNGAIDWGDYDNDGDLDLIISGQADTAVISKIYRNTGASGSPAWNFEEQTEIALMPVHHSSVKWGDYDNDGFLDLMIAGEYKNALKMRVYHNNGDNTFTIRPAFMNGLRDCDMAWGDYDNDGDLDIVLSGMSSIGIGNITKVYNNDNGVFTEQTNLNLQSVVQSSVAWADYDNDGDLDILLAGLVNTNTNFSMIYQNNGNNSFVKQEQYAFTGVSNGSALFADYDNDGDLDVLLSGNESANSIINKIYRNNLPPTNTKPIAPSNLSATIIGDSILLTWSASSDDNTPSVALTYNLRIGSSSNGIEINAPQSDIVSGFHRVVEMGALQDTFCYIKAPVTVSSCSSVYWAVQAIDHGGRASIFSSVSSFNNVFFVEVESDEHILVGDTTILNIATNACNAVTYSWTPTTGLSSATIASPTAFPLHTTTYTITASENGVLRMDSVTVFVDYFTEQSSNTFSSFYSGDVSWGDYDNDGDLDVLLSGGSYYGKKTKLYNNNGDNSFTELNNVFDGISGASVWADYDGDDDMDMLLMGSMNTGKVAQMQLNMGPSSTWDWGFVSHESFNETSNTSVDWGDFDNDGDIDLIVLGTGNSGNGRVDIYRNVGFNSYGGVYSFTSVYANNVVGTMDGDVAWADYDNDGDLDILITGEDNNGNPVTKLYQNNDSLPNSQWSFVEQTNLNFIGLKYSSIDWGDYDNDGDLDILLSGMSNASIPYTKIYRNDGPLTDSTWSFSEPINISIVGISSGIALWVDYDNDGFLDIFEQGAGSTDNITRLYQNQGAASSNPFSFEEQSSITFIGKSLADAQWADYDNDGDLDFISTGYDENGDASTNIYRNELIHDVAPQSNTVPSAPTGLNTIYQDSTIQFVWNKSTDMQSPSAALTYNIRVGRARDSVDVKAPNSNMLTGYHQIMEMGTIRDTSYLLYLSDTMNGPYLYWSVQAIDQSNGASAFSYVDSCEISKYRASFTANPVNITAPPFNVTFTNTGKGYNSWSWNFGDASFSNQKNPTHTYLFNGSYDVILYATDTTNNTVDTAMQTIVCTGGIPNPCAFTVELTQAQNSAMICIGDSVRLSATPMPNITYTWTHNGALIPNSDDSIFYAKQAGFYMVVASNGSCSMLSTNYFVLDNFSVNPPVISVIGNIAPCSNDSLKLEASAGYSSYVWNNGSQGSSIYTKVSGYYSVEAIDGNGCVVTSDETTINASLVDIPKICAVGVDPSTNHNVVSWQAVNTLKIDSFRVYKEATITNQYEYLGSVVYSTSPEFEDVNSNVAVRQYKYRILAIDTCGTESPMSLSHKTMHLQVNAAINNHWNLIWQPYEGFSFGSYKIYRGTDSLNMSLLTTVSSNVTAYTDLNNPSGDIYYQIEIESSSPCQAKSNATSRSNLFNTKDASGVGVEQYSGNHFDVQLYPNPNKGLFTVSFFNKDRQHYYLRMYNQLGSIVLERDFESQGKYNATINAQSLAKGMYFIRLISNRQIVFHGKIIVE